MKFNEDSRVKIPAILHCMKLGYEYISLKKSNLDRDTSNNIFKEIFFSSLKNINPTINQEGLKQTYDEVSGALENEDLGKAFYSRITTRSGFKVIDFENFSNNTFNVVTELTYKNRDDEFRPDITLLINGLPLAFIEVKKPNNKEGVLAEKKRISTRFKNKKFRKFINITQFMIFSNNMEYDDSSSAQIEGAFYATTSYKEPKFNYFRDEEAIESNTFSDISDFEEIKVLRDNNIISIKSNPEFLENKKLNTPTNRIITSLLSRKRLAFLLEYGIAYVKGNKSIQKHIMRYPQFFATKAISQQLDKGIKKGIIWHTQGSGKTALAFYNVKYLSNYFKSKGIIAKFYFIVDRLDLLIQASREFRARGLFVHTIDSRESFSKDIKDNSAIHNSSGMSEITVVNIQKFKDDKSLLNKNDYQINIQRIFFLDEVHRSYNPEGSFLANLEQADINSIKIGLTGTPLIGKEFTSKSIFGDYIHKYFYNASIKDGYTLRLIREEIETSYRFKLKKALEEIEILKGKTNKNSIYSHKKFVEPLLEYIVKDFETTKITTGNNEIGGMVVCDSSEQAKNMYQFFKEKYVGTESDRANKLNASLILYDEGDKEIREGWISDFKDGKTDFLFVYNMLLTGFDTERLKKLYLCRLIKSHNLLQALTRVNRPFKNFEFGYVIDFANIEKEFEKTNKNYLEELESELGDEIENYNNLFKSENEIKLEIELIQEILFAYDTKNAENFSKQISVINNQNDIRKIVSALKQSRSLYNVIRLSKNKKLLESLDFDKLSILLKEANNRLAFINLKEVLENNINTQSLLNIALEDVYFGFTKIGEGELMLADELKNILQKTREGLGSNFDQQDPSFISLKDELERLFKKRKLTEVTKEEMENNVAALNLIYDKAMELERKNQLLKAKYDNDEKYARLHKRLLEKDPLTENESKLFNALSNLKIKVDEKIENNSELLANENFIEKLIGRLVIEQFRKNLEVRITPAIVKNINNLLVSEYVNEYQGQVI